MFKAYLSIFFLIIIFFIFIYLFIYLFCMFRIYPLQPVRGVITAELWQILYTSLSAYVDENPLETICMEALFSFYVNACTKILFQALKISKHQSG